MTNPFLEIQNRLDNLENLLIGLSKKDHSSQKPNKENELFNIKEAADFLSLKVPTLYQKVSRREIPFLKRSKRLYFKRENLIEYLEKGRVKSVSEIQEEAENFFKKKGVQNG
jgi:excisionase family DNA binding protein